MPQEQVIERGGLVVVARDTYAWRLAEVVRETYRKQKLRVPRAAWPADLSSTIFQVCGIHPTVEKIQIQTRNQVAKGALVEGGGSYKRLKFWVWASWFRLATREEIDA